MLPLLGYSSNKIYFYYFHREPLGWKQASEFIFSETTHWVLRENNFIPLAPCASRLHELPWVNWFTLPSKSLHRPNGTKTNKRKLSLTETGHTQSSVTDIANEPTANISQQDSLDPYKSYEVCASYVKST